MKKSDSIKELATALCKFQGELIDPVKDKQGYGYKFVDLPQILKLTRPVLCKNGLAVSQLCSGDDLSVTIETIVMHVSGEWISSKLQMSIEPPKKSMTKAQAAGCVISYARRYGYISSLGIGQDDNDAASVVTHLKSAAEASPLIPVSLSTLDTLNDLIDSTDQMTKIIQWAQVDSIDQLSEVAAQKAIKKLSIGKDVTKVA